MVVSKAYVCMVELVVVNLGSYQHRLTRGDLRLPTCDECRAAFSEGGMVNASRTGC